MRRNGWTALAAGLVVSSTALAGEPPIPAKYVSKDTAIVARIALGDLTSQKIQDTVTALVDTAALEQAGFEGDPMEPFQQIMGQMMMVQGFTSSMIGMGATSLNMSIVPPEEEYAQPGVSLFLPVSNADNGKQLAQMFQAFGMTGNVEDNGGQHWVSLAVPGTEAPAEGGDGAGAARFNSGLESMGAASISFIVIPVEKIRGQILENLGDENEEAKAVGEAVANANWVGLTLTIGSKPQIVMSVDLPDEKAQKALSGAWDKFTGELVAKAKEAEADEEHMAEWPEGMPKPTEIAKTVGKYMSMEKKGNSLVMVLDSAELRQITTWMIVGADAMGINPMEMMGGM
ncbi:MAG: hypothetical protein IT439_04485 [Phycisphaerales bacterium]|nr:hypothetical protein [Phycisphaerales bacterium]